METAAQGTTRGCATNRQTAAAIPATTAIASLIQCTTEVITSSPASVLHPDTERL
jgi:hypothetical protein